MEISNGLGRHEYYLGPQEKIVLVKIQYPSDRGPCPEHLVLENIHLPIAFALNRRRGCQEKEILSLHTNLDPVYL